MSIPSYDDLRQKWAHEDQLINHRVTWLIQAEGLLFTAFGVFLQVPTSAPAAAKAAKLLSIFPLLGILVTLFKGAAVVAAISAQGQLKAIESNKPLEDRRNLGVAGGPTWIGFVPPLVLPIFFLVVWAVVWAA